MKKLIVYMCVLVFMFSCNEIGRGKTLDNVNLKKIIHYSENPFINLNNWKFITTEISSAKDQLKTKKFKVSLMDSIIVKDSIIFYKFQLDNCKKCPLYLGARNDTIFCYDSDINFFETFLVLNPNIKDYISWVGDTYKTSLIRVNKLNNNDMIYSFQLDTINQNYSDSDFISNYPRMIFSKIILSKQKGFRNIQFIDKESNIRYNIVRE